ncbi:hypothetical protein [Ferruginibacter sp.]
MKTNYLFTLLIAIIFLSACQKELSLENANPTPPPAGTNNDSTILKEFVYLDTLSGITDTLAKTTFEYDNLHRLTTETTVEYMNGVPYYADDYERLFYYYNGSDTIANKVIDVFYDEVDIRDSIVTFFTTNSNQVVIRDSSIYFFNNFTTGVTDTITSTSAYTIYADSIIENNRNYTYSLASEVINKFKHAITRSGSNIVKEIYYIDEPTGYREINRVTYQYDTHINPFNMGNINYPVMINNNPSGFLYDQKNNPLESVTTPVTGSASTEKYAYIYNSWAYPKTVVWSDPADPSASWKGIYIYTK